MAYFGAMGQQLLSRGASYAVRGWVTKYYLWKKKTELWEAGHIQEPPEPVRREDHIERYDAVFEPIPCFAHLDPHAYRQHVERIVQAVVDQGFEQRGGSEPIGVDAIINAHPMTRTPLPPPPWFEQRRRMIVWDDRRHPDVVAYTQRYWTFQACFRKAADAWLEGDLTQIFPPGAFRPGFSRPIPHIQSMAA
jgi:hypothetical protein